MADRRAPLFSRTEGGRRGEEGRGDEGQRPEGPSPPPTLYASSFSFFFRRNRSRASSIGRFSMK